MAPTYLELVEDYHTKQYKEVKKVFLNIGLIDDLYHEIVKYLPFDIRYRCYRPFKLDTIWLYGYNYEDPVSLIPNIVYICDIPQRDINIYKYENFVLIFSKMVDYDSVECASANTEVIDLEDFDFVNFILEHQIENIWYIKQIAEGLGLTDIKSKLYRIYLQV